MHSTRRAALLLVTAVLLTGCAAPAAEDRPPEVATRSGSPGPHPALAGAADTAGAESAIPVRSPLAVRVQALLDRS